MARNPLTEEQKKRNEEMRQIMKDQLAADAAQAGTPLVNYSLPGPQSLPEAVVYGTVNKPEDSATAVAHSETPAAAPATEAPEQRQETNPVQAASTPDQPAAPLTREEREAAAKQAQRDQLAADAAAVPTIDPNRATTPQPLNEAVVYGTPSSASETPETPATEPTTDQALAQAKEAAPAQATAPITPEEREAAAKQEQREQLARDIARSNQPEGLAPAQSLESTVDPVVAATAEAYRNQDKGFVQLLQGMKDEYERQRQEGEQQIKDQQNAAKWTGLTELAASLANMIGVGQGNAVSQTYRPHSQDWMQKADASIKEHRSKMQDLRQRQRETELKISQLRAEGGLAVAQMQAKQRQQAIENEMNRQKLILDERYKAGQMTIDQYKAETSRLQALATQAYRDAQIKTQNARIANETRRLDLQEQRLPSQIALDEARKAQAEKAAGIKPTTPKGTTPSADGGASQPAAPAKKVRKGFFNPKTGKEE